MGWCAAHGTAGTREQEGLPLLAIGLVRLRVIHLSDRFLPAKASTAGTFLSWLTP